MSPRAPARPKIVRCQPLELPGEQQRAPLWRAELFFHGLDLLGPSYRAAVFLNHGRVTHDTPEDADHGYAGAFFLFGKGGCFGEEGHCHPRPRRGRFDTRLIPQTYPTSRAVDVTEAVRREIAAGAEELVATLVPEVADSAGVLTEGDLAAPIKFEQVGLVTYDAYAPAAQRAYLAAG